MRRVIPGLETPESLIEPEIGARLDRVEEELEKAVVADSDLLSATARYLLQAGGKRFRPMLVLLAGYFGDPADPRLIPGSVAIELTHLATLYHDDVIDESDDRRGVPSANARWDNTVAILTGDYLFALASEMSADLGPDVCRLLARTITVLCDGQIREVDAAGRVDQNEEGYLEVIRRKTGSLIATSCRLGGMLSDAAPPDVETLGAFGESLGLAFQLSDDIMDITSTQGELGKEPGTDMRRASTRSPCCMRSTGVPTGRSSGACWITDRPTARGSTERCRSFGEKDRSGMRAAPSGPRFVAPWAWPSSSPTAPPAAPWCSSRVSSRSVAAPTRVRTMSSSRRIGSASKPLLGYGSLRGGSCTT
jgi:heptaprenyl diphosphate synthase